LYILIFYVFRQQMRRQKVMDWMIANITRIQSALNFPLNQILICYCRTQIFQPWHFQRICLLFICLDFDLHSVDEITYT
jgi:hypothetical protein